MEDLTPGAFFIAIPLHDHGGSTVAALSISTRADRMTTSEMVSQFLPTLLHSQDWARSRMAA